MAPVAGGRCVLPARGPFYGKPDVHPAKEQAMKTAEERLERLEEENWFLQDKLRQLDEALQEQQKQIDRLERALADAGSAVEFLRASLEALGQGKSQLTFEEPPHYGKW